MTHKSPRCALQPASIGKPVGQARPSLELSQRPKPSSADPCIGTASWIGDAMEEWARRKNVERFLARLQAAIDPQERRWLQELLDLERRRLAELLSRKGDLEPPAAWRRIALDPLDQPGS